MHAGSVLWGVSRRKGSDSERCNLTARRECKTDQLSLGHYKYTEQRVACVPLWHVVAARGNGVAPNGTDVKTTKDTENRGKTWLQTSSWFYFCALPHTLHRVSIWVCEFRSLLLCFQKLSRRNMAQLARTRWSLALGFLLHKERGLRCPKAGLFSCFAYCLNILLPNTKRAQTEPEYWNRN
jgi:hypothetical protein